MIVLTPAKSTPQTVIVSGCGKSGTTAVSRVCNSLGFEWIQNAANVMEHTDLRDAVSTDDLSAIGYFVRDVERQGCKLPMVPASQLLNAADLFPVPAFVFVYRDAVSCALSHLRQHPTRNRSVAFRDLAASQKHAADNAEAVAKWHPTTCISYEHLLRDPVKCTHDIAQYLDSEWTPAAVAEVIPGDRRYRGNA